MASYARSPHRDVGCTVKKRFHAAKGPYAAIVAYQPVFPSLTKSDGVDTIVPIVN